MHPEGKTHTDCLTCTHEKRCTLICGCCCCCWNIWLVDDRGFSISLNQELREKQVRQQSVLDDLYRVKEEKLRELQIRREEEREKRRREEEEAAR